MRRSTTPLAAMAVFIAALFALPAAAQATARYPVSSACSSGHFCGWEDFNYTGSKYIDTTPSNCTRCQIDGWNGDNEISSVKNRTSCKVRLYDNDNWTGTTLDIPAHNSKSNLELAGFDNEAESYKYLC